MGVLQLLTTAANHLGLIRVVEVKNPDKPKKVTMRAVTLAELTLDIQSQQLRDLSDQPAELSVELQKIFEAAGIKSPTHGWNIPRLQEFLASVEFQGMAREAAQQKLLAQLAADKVSVDELVQEAIQRDKAIDTYETFAFEKMKQRVQSRKLRLAAIQEQIAALQKEQSRLDQQTKSDQEHWTQWHGRKTAYEQQLAQALSHLLDKPIVTIDTDPHPLSD